MRKQTYFSIVFFILSRGIYAQSSTSDGVLDFADVPRSSRMWTKIDPDTFVKDHHITSVKVVQYEQKFKGKSKDEYTTVLSYDSFGFRIRDEIFKKGKLSEYAVREVDTAGNVLHLEYFIGKKSVFEYFNNLNAFGKTESYFYYRKGELQSGNKYFYDSQLRVKEAYSYNKDTVKYKTLTQYFYREDTNRLATVMSFDSKGKMKHIWTYTCNDVMGGRRSEIKKQSRICESVNHLPNGNTQEVWMRQDLKTIHRWITEYDSLKRLVRYDYYNGKTGEKIWSSTTCEYSDSGSIKKYLIYMDSKKTFPDIEHNYYYNLAGNETHHITYMYNNRGKLMDVWEYTFIYDNDLLVSRIGENLKKPKRKQWITELYYQYWAE